MTQKIFEPKYWTLWPHSKSWRLKIMIGSAGFDARSILYRKIKSRFRSRKHKLGNPQVTSRSKNGHLAWYSRKARNWRESLVFVLFCKISPERVGWKPFEMTHRLTSVDLWKELVDINRICRIELVKSVWRIKMRRCLSGSLRLSRLVEIHLKNK